MEFWINIITFSCYTIMVSVFSLSVIQSSIRYYFKQREMHIRLMQWNSPNST
jgi:hypothetical protein